MIFIGQLAKEGCVPNFADDTWKISKWAMTIAWGKKNDSFYLTIDDYDFHAFAENKEDSNLWHQRLDHMSGMGLEIMHSNGKLPRLNSIEIDM